MSRARTLSQLVGANTALGNTTITGTLTATTANVGSLGVTGISSFNGNTEFNGTYLKIPTSSSNPASTSNGAIYYNTTNSSMYFYSNGTWIRIEGRTNQTVDVFGDNSVVAFYKFNGDATDATGSYNGTETDVTYTTGKISQAVSMNGDGTSRIVLPASLMDVFNGSNEWAISCWFYITTIAGKRHPLLSPAGTDYKKPGVWIQGANSKLQYFATSNGSSWNICVGDVGPEGNGSTTINQGQWYHLAWTRSNTLGFRGYVNGSLDFTNSNTTALHSTSITGYIGSWFFDNSGYSLLGYVDNYRIFNRYLTSDDVTSIYNLENA